MFENGSLLRRRKRFKLHKADKELLENELAALSTMNRMMQQQQQQQQQAAPPADGPGRRRPAQPRGQFATRIKLILKLIATTLCRCYKIVLNFIEFYRVFCVLLLPSFTEFFFPRGVTTLFFCGTWAHRIVS